MADIIDLTEWEVPVPLDQRGKLASIEAAEEGAERALRHARPELVRAAEEAIDELDATKVVWSPDDVWACLEGVLQPGDEKRFLGGVIKQKMKQLGFRCVYTGNSNRVRHHHGHMNFYLSSVCRDWNSARGPAAEKAKRIVRIWDAKKAVRAYPCPTNLRELEEARIDLAIWQEKDDGLEDELVLE